MTTTPNLGMSYMSAGQLQKEVLFNANMDIIDSAVSAIPNAFSNNALTTTGLVYGYFGGNIYSNGAGITIADGTKTLTGLATNYVQRTAAGIVSVNTTGYTVGLIPMATVVTGASSITTITDMRPSASDLRGRQVITTTGGALTMTDAQVNARVLSIQGALTSNAVITLPIYQQEWTISNETTGAFTVSVQTASGSPIEIGQGLAEKVYGNGSILKSSESRLLQESDLFSDFIASGIVGAPVTGLAMTLPSGVAYILGQRTTPAAYAFTYAASSDSYVDLSPEGVYTVVPVANGVAEPAVTAGAVRVQVVVTSATDVTGVTQRLGLIPPRKSQMPTLIISTGGVGIIPSLSTSATGGTLPASTQYSYYIAPVYSNGGIACVSGSTTPYAQITTGTGTTNSNTLTWTADPSAVSYNVYGRTPAGGFLVNVTGTTWTDDGSLSSTGQWPNEISTAFTTIKLAGIVEDTTGGFSAIDSSYTIPQDGIYQFACKLRFVDGSPPGVSYSLAANGTNGGGNTDGTFNQWFSTFAATASRQGALALRIGKFLKGDKITMYAYADAAMYYNAAELNIVMLEAL